MLDENVPFELNNNSKGNQLPEENARRDCCFLKSLRIEMIATDNCLQLASGNSSFKLNGEKKNQNNAFIF